MRNHDFHINTCNVIEAINILLASFEISVSSDENSTSSYGDQESEEEIRIDFEFILLLFCCSGLIDNV